MPLSPIPLTAQQIKTLRLLESRALETALTAQQRLRDLEEFKGIFCQSVLAEQGIEGGNYRLDLDCGLLMQNEPQKEGQ